MENKGSYWAKHKEKIHSAVRCVHRSQPLTQESRKVFEEGQVIRIDKPLHWTSFDIVRKIRNAIGIKKVGHAGTLDPLATGLLIICTGKFTKRINEFMASEKEYTGTFTLGATTPTYDLESEPVNQVSVPINLAEQIKRILPDFTGEISQVPPIYSAIKKDGVASYQLARRGEAIELQPRIIQISEFEITKQELPILHFRVVCSTGTYIRSLGHDFGQALGCGAYLSALRRTRIGDEVVENALTIDSFIESLARDDHQHDKIINS